MSNEYTKILIYNSLPLNEWSENVDDILYSEQVKVEVLQKKVEELERIVKFSGKWIISLHVIIGVLTMALGLGVL